MKRGLICIYFFFLQRYLELPDPVIFGCLFRISGFDMYIVAACCVAFFTMR